MKREVNLSDISDGKLYELNDMVRADCNDCTGCFACCHGMGNSIILDPYDIYLLSNHLNMTFEQMLADKIELHVVDGVILPNLKMDNRTERCVFLNEAGRCSIHKFRPGICRLFPLGRYYESKSFRYFLQVNECKKENRAKVKVKKWLDTPDLKKHETFVNEWHYFLLDVEDILNNEIEDKVRKEITMYLLIQFYQKPYQNENDFYTQVGGRILEAKEYFNVVRQKY